MNYTLLKVVQKTLDAMDSDSVNSIFDTDESEQVVSIIEEVFNEMIIKEDGHITQFGELESLSDPSKPNFLKSKVDTYGIQKIYYNEKEVEYISNDDYVKRYIGDSTGNKTKLNGLYFSYDKQPTVCTSFNDNELVFNSVDGLENSTLQGSKSNAILKVIPAFIEEDDFVIPIPEDSLVSFMAEVKIACFQYIQGERSSIDEQNARTGMYIARRRKVFESLKRKKTKYARKK